MTQETRALLFHTGTYKTGSTALQQFLAQNQGRLAEAGIAYEFVPDADRTMGNGRRLFELLLDRQVADEALDPLMELHLSCQRIGVCSSEDLSHFREAEWRQVSDACGRRRIQARTVTFVRNVAPFYRSLYAQLVKGGVESASFAEFCGRDHFELVLDSLRACEAVFGRDSMSVLHYESERSEIDAALLQILDVAGHCFDRTAARQTTNRSLTAYEQEILARVARATGTQHASDLSVHLMQRRPNLRAPDAIDAGVLEVLASRHRQDVEWVNARFFGGHARLEIHAEADRGPIDASATDATEREIDRDVADWLLGKLRSAQEESLQFVAARLRAIDWDRAGHPVIAADFDPIAYLLLNPDVMRAGMPPYRHFITSGQFEEGRPIKWPS